MCEHSTKFCIINCALLYGSMQSVSPAHAHCTALYTLHILHTRYPLLSHHYTPSGVAHNILAEGSMSTQMLYISQKPTNSTKLDSASSVFKGCTLPLSAALQHISCQGVALYFNYTLPRLFVLYSLHFMYTMVLGTFHAYVPIHVHIGTGRGRSGALW